MTKKTAKKSIKKTTAIPFNKKNAIAFGQHLFQEKGSEITFVKLCYQSLENVANKKVVHCIIGEAYFNFVDHSLKQVYKLGDNKYESQYISNDQLDGGSDGPTIAAIELLVDKAILASKSSKRKLSSALVNCMRENDSIDGEDAEDYLRRAEQVAMLWNKIVVPLLK
jgi:hypothetical protein